MSDQKSTDRGMLTVFPLASRMILFSVAYYGCAVWSRLFSLDTGSFVTFWLPSGLFVAVLLVNERRYWPGLVLAAIMANMAFDLSNAQKWYVSALFSSGNCLEALVGAWLVQRFVTERPRLSTVKEMDGVVLLAALLSPILSATVASSALLLVKGHASDFCSIWFMWWGGNVLGVLLLTPVILTWQMHFRWPLRLKLSPKQIEDVLLILVVFAVALFVFCYELHKGMALKYILLPVLIWVATRFTVHDIVIVNLFVAMIASWFTAQGLSDISHSGFSIQGQIIALQLYLAVVTVTELIVSILLAEHKRTEAALRESEGFFRLAFDKSPSGAAITKIDGHFLRVNAEMARITGYSPQELKSKTFLELTHPDFREKNKQFVQSLFNGAIEQYIMDKQYIRKNGSLIWVHVSVRLARDENNQPLYLFGVVEDFTERKRVEAALRLSEEKFVKAFHSSPVVMGISTLNEGRFVEVNTSFETISGYLREEVIGKTAEELHIYHDIQQRNDMLRILRQQGFVRNFECTLLAKSGILNYGLFSLEIIEIDDVKYLLSTLSDITDRKRAEEALKASEEKFRSFVECAPEAVFVRIGGRFAYLNPEAVKLFGATKAEDLIGRSVIDRVRPDLRPAVAERMRQLDVSKMRIPPEEQEYLRLDGSCIPVEVSAMPIQFQGAEGALIFARDITDRKQAEFEVRKLAAVVRNTNEIVCVSTIDGKIIFLNEAGLKILGLPREKIPEVDALQLVPDHLKPKMQRELLPMLNAGGKWEGDLQYRNWTTGALIDVHAMLFTILHSPAGLPLYHVSISQDITERKRAETKLRESERRFRAIFNSTFQFMGLLHPDGKIIEINDAGVVFSGQQMQDLRGRLFWDARWWSYSPQIKAQVKAAVAQATAGKFIRYEVDALDNGGRRITTDSSLKPIFDEHGQVVQLLAEGRDITERKQIEEALRESERRFRAIFNSAFQYVGLLEPNGKILEINETALLFAGLKLEDIRGQYFWERELWSYSKQVQERVKEAVAQAASGLLVRYEAEAQKADGKLFTIDNSLKPILDEQGRVTMLLGEGRDITERKKAEVALRASELKFRNLAEESPNMIFINKRGRVVFANKLCSSIMKYRPEEFYDPDFNFMDLIAPEHKELVKSNYQGHMAGEYIPPCEYTLITKGGERIESLINTSLIDYEGELAILGIVTVITERKRMENALRESEVRYRRLVDSTTDYIYTVRVENGNVVETIHGPGCVAVTGYNAEDYRTDSYLWFRMIYENDRAAVLTQISKALEGESALPLEHRIYHKDGTLHWLRNTIVLHKDQSGKVVSYDGLVSDITERKRAEEEIQRVASLLKATLQSTADGILVVSKTGKILDFNDRFAQMWRIPSDILESKDDDQALGFVLDQLIHPHVFLDKVRELYSKPEVASFDELEFKDGRVFERFSIPLVMEDSYTGRVWCFRDVSIHRKALKALAEGEERFRELFNRMSSGVAVYEAVNNGEDFVFKDINMAGQRLTHVRREEIIKRSVGEIFPSVKSIGLFSVFQQVWRTGIPQFHPVTLYQDGRISLWVDNQVYKLPSGEIVAVYDDITERKQAEEALKIAKEMAEASEKVKSEFLTNISHDFRTPLSAILGFSAFLESAQLDERSKKVLGIIQEKSQTLLAMTGDLLEASGIKAGKTQLRSMEFDLSQLISDAVEVARLEAGEKDIIISCVFKDEIPRFKGDPIRVEQIISNILTNAVKYTEKGTIQVTVGCSPQPGQMDRRLVKVSVKDTGLGIPQDKQDQVFEPFTRFHEFAGGKKYTGVGLGLHIAKTMVNLMGGEIAVESEVGKGSEFVFTLDLVLAS